MSIPFKIFYDGHVIPAETPLPPAIPVIIDFRLDGDRFAIKVNFGAAQAFNQLQGIENDRILEQLLQSAIGASHFFGAAGCPKQHDFSKEPGLYEE